MADEPFGRKSEFPGSVVAMKIHYLIVEGQTEQRFAEQILVPRAAAKDIHLQVFLPRTGRAASGLSAHGGGAWKHMAGIAGNFLNAPGVDKVGVLFDVYGSEFAVEYSDLSGYELRATVQARAAESILHTVKGDQAQRLTVGPVLYEFETLIIAALASGNTKERGAIVNEARNAIRKAGGEVELVNGSVSTSPSHRVAHWWEKHLGAKYEKTVDGSRILSEVAWSEIEETCPSFTDWAADFLS